MGGLRNPEPSLDHPPDRRAFGSVGPKRDQPPPRPERKMSWMWRTPLGQPWLSTIKYMVSGPDGFISMDASASAASTLASMVFGFRVIRSSTDVSMASGVLTMIR